MRTMMVDLETYSSVDIKRSGMHRYVQSPDFEILLFGYAFDDEPVEVVDLTGGNVLPVDLIKVLQDPSFIKKAFNAPFEWYCLNKFYNSPLEQWRCVMLHGLYCGYAGSLGTMGAAIGLPVNKQKMGVGSSLIRTFCVPTKPSKANGMRRRILPHHEPEKWQLFKQYCAQDVASEREIERRLFSFPVPEAEQKLWGLDQQINAFGVAVDRDFVQSALYIDEKVTAELTEEAVKLSGLDNPKSVKQLSEWLNKELEEEDVEVEDLRKETVTALIKDVESDKARRMLEIRQELSKASVKKYAAMRDAVCDDGRIRGLLQFYGAHRTGRWASRLVQIQNLARNSLETLNHARECVKARKIDALRIVYGNVPDTLSQLVRTAIVPGKYSNGEVRSLAVADFSAIEARVIAWLAGEQWKMDVFARDGKIYEATASAMFGVPVEQIDKHSPLRQKGKVAELACIAEGQLVLTDSGLVPIERVTKAVRVWDGVEFVAHDGVIFKGVQEVITYDGLTATPDHLVWVEGQPRPIRFGESAASGACLLRSSPNWTGVRASRDTECREALERKLESRICADALSDMQQCSMDGVLQPQEREIQGLPALLTAPTDTTMVRPQAHGSETALHKPERRELGQLRRQGNRIPVQFDTGSGPLDTGKLGPTFSRHGDGSDRQQRTLRTWEPPLRAKGSEPWESALDGSARVESGTVAVCPDCGHADAICGDDARADSSERTGCGDPQKKELAVDQDKARVYDILNCGPRNRYTVNGVLVHNCGYGGGANALIKMGALQQGLTEDELPEIVHRWRSANRRIVDFWHSLENAALRVMQTGQTTGSRNLLLAREGDYQHGQDFLTIRLPSGRKLYYVKPFIAQNDRGQDALYYYGVGQNSKKWEATSTWGGKLAENVTQAIARDCLAESIARLASYGYSIVFHVHDEIVCEVPALNPEDPEHLLKQIIAVTEQPIAWAPGLTLKADGYVCDYYQKN